MCIRFGSRALTFGGTSSSSSVLRHHGPTCGSLGSLWIGERSFSGDRPSGTTEEACDQFHETKGRPFHAQLFYEKVCFNDASDRGWGPSPGQPDLFDYFMDNNLRLHINLKEFKGAVFALKSHMMHNKTLHFLTDSTTLYHYLRKRGSRFPHLNRVIYHLWEYTRKQNVQFVPHFIPSEFNPAYKPSCMEYSMGRTTLTNEMMQRVKVWASS